MAEHARVPSEARGDRLDRWLGEQPGVGSRAAAQRLIGAGRVQVEGGRPKSSLRLEGGEEVHYEPFEDVAGQVPPEPSIVHADDWLLVVDKPPRLAVHPAPGHHQTTLAELLAGEARGGEEGRRGIVHRLDRDTSGLLVVARTEEAHRALSAEMKARRISREYAALVAGQPESASGTIEAPIGRDTRDPARMTVGGAGARTAVTHFEVEEALPRHTLLAIRLDTGRTHQIRVHLAAVGLPVAGDATYGAPGELGLHRQFLHARRLAFTHPGTGEEAEFRSGLPADLASALEKARSLRG